MKIGFFMRFFIQKNITAFLLFLMAYFLPNDFSLVKEKFIEAKQGSIKEKFLFIALFGLASCFNEFKLIHRYISNNAEAKTMILKEMYKIADCFDDWYYLFILSKSNSCKKECLLKMLFLANDFYEVRCVHANSNEFYEIKNRANELLKIICH